jgi:hypothetical protein
MTSLQERVQSIASAIFAAADVDHNGWSNKISIVVARWQKESFSCL